MNVTLELVNGNVADYIKTLILVLKLTLVEFLIFCQRSILRIYLVNLYVYMSVYHKVRCLPLFVKNSSLNLKYLVYSKHIFMNVWVFLLL